MAKLANIPCRSYEEKSVDPIVIACAVTEELAGKPDGLVTPVAYEQLLVNERARMDVKIKTLTDSQVAAEECSGPCVNEVNVGPSPGASDKIDNLEP